MPELRCMYQFTPHDNPICSEEIIGRGCAYPSFECDVKKMRKEREMEKLNVS